MVATQSKHRRDPRISLESEAVVRLGNTRLVCKTRNLARKGIGLTSPIPHQPGSLVEVDFRLPNAKVWVKTNATLIWENPRSGSYDWGLKFKDYEYLELEDEYTRGLVRKVVLGDAQAWQEFVERFADLMFSLAWQACAGDQRRSSRLFLRTMQKLRNPDLLQRYLIACRRYPGRLRLATWLTRQAQKLMWIIEI